MPASVKDVAALAGVSPKTVSNVVHDRPNVAPRTRLRVEAAMVELGYRPNLSARSLRSGRTGLLMLAIPDLSAPYFAELSHLIIDAAAEHGYTVLIEETEGRRERESMAVRGVPATLVDGTIISPLALDPKDVEQGPGGVPLVLLGERIAAGSADHVSWDNVLAARDATQHLIRMGRRRIAVIGRQADPSAATSRLRYDGFRSALHDEDIGDFSTPPVLVEGFTRQHGVRALDELLQREDLPDAVLCFNDELAIGAMRRLHELGRRVPDDVAVVGIDDIKEAAFVTPSLTTVAPDKVRLAQAAVSCLIDRLGGPGSHPPRDVLVPHRLIVRESSRRIG